MKGPDKVWGLEIRGPLFCFSGDPTARAQAAVEDSVALSASDREMLSGAQGPARQAALSVVLRLAQLQRLGPEDERASERAGSPQLFLPLKSTTFPLFGGNMGYICL